MKKIKVAIGAAFLLLAASLMIAPVRRVFAQTFYNIVQSEWIQNSLIDSTPIGTSTPSSGQFTWTQSNVAPASPNAQGLYTAWDESGVTGESDFINNRGQGVGGFTFYNATSGGTLGSSIAHMDGIGNFTAPSFIGALTGNVTGNVTGNAGTATVLASTPTQCSGSTPIASGIQANGNANCFGLAAFTGTSGYQTLPSGLILEWGVSVSFDTGPQSQSLPLTFPHACLFASAGDNIASSSRRIWAAACSSASAITLGNDGLGQGNWFAIGY